MNNNFRLNLILQKPKIRELYKLEKAIKEASYYLENGIDDIDEESKQAVIDCLNEYEKEYDKLLKEYIKAPKIKEDDYDN